MSARGVEKEDQQVWDHVGDREVGVPLQLRHQTGMLIAHRVEFYGKIFSWVSLLDFLN